MRRLALLLCLSFLAACDDGDGESPPVDAGPDAEPVDMTSGPDIGPAADMAPPADMAGPADMAADPDMALEPDMAAPPACDFPLPALGEGDEVAALAAAPARCGLEPFTWWQSDELGTVVSRREVQRLPAAALGPLTAAAGIEIPRPFVSDIILEQVEYVTQARGERVLATALVGHPVDPPPDAPDAIFTILHGTAGFSDDCAPSNGLETQGLVAAVAATGYTVVAPDYIGLKGTGEPTGFLHPYLVGQPTAMAVLDSVRAVGHIAREGGRCVTPDVVMLGGSQGGHAVLWAELLAPYYAAELNIRGSVATVPPADIGRQIELAIATRIDATFNALGLFVTGAEWYGHDLAEVLLPPLNTALPEVAAMSCDYGELELDEADYPDAASIWTAEMMAAVDAGELLDFGPWGCMVAQSSLLDTDIARLDRGAPGHGILYVLAENDELVNTPVERDAFDALCADGWPLQFLECARAEHGPATIWALPEIFDFMDARLAGEPLGDAACQRAAPVACRGEPME